MLWSTSERSFAEAVRRFAYANPCDPDVQTDCRRELQSFNLETSEDESRRPPVLPINGGWVDPFADLFARRLEVLIQRIAGRFLTQANPYEPDDVARYEDLVITALYLRHVAPLDPLPVDSLRRPLADLFTRFRDDFTQWTSLPVTFTPFFDRAEHMFAVFFQHRLAGALLYHLIRGTSRPVVRLRADIWHSIFPRELRWYGVLLYQRMHEVTTLILGPSGTGKELVATAIGLARYVPFDARRRQFTEQFAGAVHPLNLSAMPRDLIESEMFGHAAGAFTGAVGERTGWFEKCRRGQTVFLDELGELPEPVQLRLLRVLQSREFYRVGDVTPRRFEGRVIAATNRNLVQLMSDGRFREDLYFRLCSDQIQTPTLRQQLDDSLDDLPALVQYAASRCLGNDAPAAFVDQLSSDVLEWIEQSPALGLSYAWPGNFRELEQCIRSVMVRGAYHPPERLPASRLSPSVPMEPTELDRFLNDVAAGRLTQEQILERYCSLIFARTGNVAETARRLKRHRATVQARLRPEWVERFRKVL